MTIRHATAEDVPAVAALEAACFPDPWPDSFIARRLGGLLAAFEAETLIGYASLSWVLDEGSLDSIAVSPEHRRQGIGDALLDEAVKWARSRELSFITLEVRAGNRPAIALYRKHGFIRAGLRKNYYEKPREDAILMTLVLS